MSNLETLQKFIHGAIASDTYFSDVGLYLLRPRVKADGSTQSLPDIQERISLVLTRVAPVGGKSGAALTVSMPVIIADKNNRGLLTVATVIRCHELPKVNMGSGGTRKSAEDLGIRVIQALDGLVMHGVCQELFFDKEAMKWTDDYEPFWTYEVTVLTHLNMDEAERVAQPRIAVDGAAPAATVTITCATADAEIYYTTDGSFPSAVNTSATLYDGAFSIDEPVTIFAAAYKTDLAGSNVATAEVEGEAAEPDTTALREDGGIRYREDGTIAEREG